MKKILGVTTLAVALALAGGLFVSNRASASGNSLCPLTGKPCANSAKCTTLCNPCPLTGTTCPGPCERCSQHSAGHRTGVL